MIMWEIYRESVRRAELKITTSRVELPLELYNRLGTYGVATVQRLARVGAVVPANVSAPVFHE